MEMSVLLCLCTAVSPGRKAGKTHRRGKTDRRAAKGRGLLKSGRDPGTAGSGDPTAVISQCIQKVQEVMEGA